LGSPSPCPETRNFPLAGRAFGPAGGPTPARAHGRLAASAVRSSARKTRQHTARPPSRTRASPPGALAAVIGPPLPPSSVPDRSTGYRPRKPVRGGVLVAAARRP